MVTPLTKSAELTFQSYRHSQGVPGFQHHLLHYLADKAALYPDLTASPELLAKFSTFLGGQATRRHIYVGVGMSPEGISKKVLADSVESTVKSELENLEKQFKLELDKPAPAVPDLCQELVQQVEIDRTFGRIISGKFLNGYGRLERATHRMETGALSHLYYFGRDGRNTGIEPLNTLYAEMWTYYQDPAFAPAAAAHQSAATRAEQTIRAALAGSFPKSELS